MSIIRIAIGPLKFTAELRTDLAPITCAEFLKILPLKKKILQARWSGESAWVPLGDLKLAVKEESATAHPQPGELLFYQGPMSETEILFPYGKTVFACRAGELKGSSFLVLRTGQEQLSQVGDLVLWQGAQDITFEKAESTKV